MEQRYNGNCEEYDGRQYSRGGLVKTQVSSIVCKNVKTFSNV